LPVAIIDTITTITEVCLLQGHSMNTLADSGSTRIFSDDMISTIINNVVRFVYANSREDLLAEAELFIINTLSTIALNNVMHEAGHLPEWQFQDPFDKARLYEMMVNIREDEITSRVIPMYRGQFHNVEDST